MAAAVVKAATSLFTAAMEAQEAQEAQAAHLPHQMTVQTVRGEWAAKEWIAVELGVLVELEVLAVQGLALEVAREEQAAQVDRLFLGHTTGKVVVVAAAVVAARPARLARAGLQAPSR